MYDWQVWESDVASALNGCTVKASGQKPLHKGDAKTSKLLVDAKYTNSTSYTLTRETWENLSEWAINETKEPVLAVKSDNADEGVYSVAVIPEYYYFELFPESAELVLVAKNDTSRTLRKLDDGEVELFSLAGYRLVEMDFDAFVERYVDIETQD